MVAHARRAALVSTLCALAVALDPAAASAGGKDAELEKAITAAIDEDYLDTRFDDAERRLRAALEKCGDSCSKPARARAWATLGAILAGGKKELDDAREAFVEALTLDPTVAPPDDVASTQVSFAYEKARSDLKLDAPTRAPTDFEHAPHPEQQRDTPLPVHVQLSGKVAERVDEVRVTYRPPGGTTWKTQKLRSLGGGAFGTNLPCDDLGELGTVEYYLLAIDDEQRVLATAGTESRPLSTRIADTKPSSPPHWPGYEPPRNCADDAPRPLETDQACTADTDCSTGYRCRADKCVLDSSAAAPEKRFVRRNWFTLAYSPDLALFDGSDVCSAENQKVPGNLGQSYVCFRENGSRYAGTPTPGQGNDVALGVLLGSMRVMLGYERLVEENFTLGARLGVSFLGAPQDFLPFHAEGRFAYWFGHRPFDQIARPFLSISGGLGQVDSGIRVEVLEDGDACGAANPADPASPCAFPSFDGTVEPRVQGLSAYRQLGMGFVGLGAGVVLAPTPMFGFHLAVRANVTLPVAAFVLSPEAGLTVGF